MKVSYFNIQRFCLQDGPGIRSTLFMKGCPMRCVWCHNPEGKAADPELLFFADRCTLCGACLDLCGARGIRNGKTVTDLVAGDAEDYVWVLGASRATPNADGTYQWVLQYQACDSVEKALFEGEVTTSEANGGGQSE